MVTEHNLWKFELNQIIFREFGMYLEIKEKQEEVWLSPMTKALTPTEK